MRQRGAVEVAGATDGVVRVADVERVAAVRAAEAALLALVERLDVLVDRVDRLQDLAVDPLEVAQLRRLWREGR